MDSGTISQVAAHFELELEAASAEKIATWLTLLSAWNKKLDLTAAKTHHDLLDVMLADAFVLAKYLKRDARVVDVGSGAGAPGLPLALARPDLKMTLVEPLAKRVSFLRTALAEVRRTDIQVKRLRSEELERGHWDVAMSRATLSPEAWLAEGSTLIADDGEVCVLLAKESAPIQPHLRQIESFAYAWPRSGHARSLVRYAK